MASINIEQSDDLISYLKKNGVLKFTDDATCQMLSGGVSNSTILVTSENGSGLLVKQALSKLRVKEDWHSDQERILVEAKALEYLPNLVKADTFPALIHVDAEEFIVVMQAIPQPHENWKSILLRGEVDVKHVEQFAQILAQIHCQTFDNNTYASVFGEQKFFRSLRLDAYYRFASEHVSEARSFLRNLIAETEATNTCLVHGDFSPKNVLVFQNRLILLDFEVMHFGDGAFDIGFAMTHFLSKANYLKQHKAKFIEAARLFWQVYHHFANIDVTMESRAVRHTMGCLLSRVKGKSPLEYLSEGDREFQLAACLSLLNRIPPTMYNFIEMWETINHE